MLRVKSSCHYCHAPRTWSKQQQQDLPWRRRARPADRPAQVAGPRSAEYPPTHVERPWRSGISSRAARRPGSASTENATGHSSRPRPTEPLPRSPPRAREPRQRKMTSGAEPTRAGHRVAPLADPESHKGSVDTKKETNLNVVDVRTV